MAKNKTTVIQGQDSSSNYLQVVPPSTEFHPLFPTNVPVENVDEVQVMVDIIKGLTKIQDKDARIRIIRSVEKFFGMENEI